MIWAAVVVGKGGDYEVTQGKTVGLFVGLLVVHGILVCLSFFPSSTFISLSDFHSHPALQLYLFYDKPLELSRHTVARASYGRLRFHKPWRHNQCVLP